MQSGIRRYFGQALHQSGASRSSRQHFATVDNGSMAAPYLIKQERGQVICLLDTDSEPGDVASPIDLTELDDSRSGFPAVAATPCGKPAARARSRSRSPRG